MELADIALGQRDQADLAVFHQLEESGDVLLVAGEAVETFGQNDVDLAGADGSLQGQIARPLVVGAGDGGVGEQLDDLPPLAISPGATNPDLILDRGLALGVAAIARINRRPHGWLQSLSKIVLRFGRPFAA